MRPFSIPPLSQGFIAAMLAVLLTSVPLAGYGENPASGEAAPAQDTEADPVVRAYLDQQTAQIHQCYQGNIVSTRYAVRVRFTLGTHGNVVEVRVLTRGRFVPVARIACVVRTLKGLKLPETSRRCFVYTFSWGMTESVEGLLDSGRSQAGVLMTSRMPTSYSSSWRKRERGLLRLAGQTTVTGC